jgi:hypothetical protein
MIQKISLLTAALLLSLFAFFPGSAPPQNGAVVQPQVECPPCKFGYKETGVYPFCACTKSPV